MYKVDYLKAQFKRLNNFKIRTQFSLFIEGRKGSVIKDATSNLF